MSTLIPAIMLAVLVVALVCGLIGRHAGKAMLVSVGLFVISLWFPEPVVEEYRNLHWFPVSLLLLILTLFGTTATLVIGVAARAILGAARGHKAKGGPDHGAAS